MTKTRQKLDRKIREIDWSYCSCNDLTNFENQVCATTENETYVNLSKTCFEKFVKSLRMNLFSADFSFLEPPCNTEQLPAKKGLEWLPVAAAMAAAAWTAICLARPSPACLPSMMLLFFFLPTTEKKTCPSKRKKTKHKLHLTKFRFYPSILQWTKHNLYYNIPYIHT